MHSQSTCLIEDCDRPHYARGLCSRHSQQARKGKIPFPFPSRLPKTATQEERFWDKVEKGESCWLWTAATMKHGYGVFSQNGLAHRFAYELLIGPIPDGYEVDHLCYVRNCVRPDHLEAVPRSENIARQRQHGAPPKDFCKRGHPYDKENTRIEANGHRICRACGREAMRRYRTRKHHNALTPQA